MIGNIHRGYFRRDEKTKKRIYACPGCGMNVVIDKEFMAYVMKEFWARGGRKAQEGKTHEQRVAMGKRGAEKRWGHRNITNQEISI